MTSYTNTSDHNSSGYEDWNKSKWASLGQSYSNTTQSAHGEWSQKTSIRSGSHGHYSLSIDRHTALVKGGKDAAYPAWYAKWKAPAEAKRALKGWQPTNGALHDAPALYQPDTTIVKQDTTSLRPQKLTIRRPEIEHIPKKGNRMLIKVILDKSHPNYRFIFEYEYLAERKREEIDSPSNVFVQDQWQSRALITTNENTWRILFEWAGKHEEPFKALLGDDEYAKFRLTPETGSLAQLAGTPNRRNGMPSEDSQVATAIVPVPVEYDLPRMWCISKGFYELWVYIPAVSYMRDKLKDGK